MPLDRCSKCDCQIDIDAHPEAYREELDYACVCDWCMEKDEVLHSIPEGRFLVVYHKGMA